MTVINLDLTLLSQLLKYNLDCSRREDRKVTITSQEELMHLKDKNNVSHLIVKGNIKLNPWLGWYSRLRTLEIYNNEVDKQLNRITLPCCKKLICKWNILLQTLPNIPNCEDIICSRNSLTILPKLDKCITLDCYGNRITSLPDLPNCKDLCCSSNSITELPQLSECVTLNCSCNNLTEISIDLSKCETLYCSYNELTSISDLPKCIKLCCENNNLNGV